MDIGVRVAPGAATELSKQLSSITGCIKYALSKLEHPIPAMDVLEKWIGPPLQGKKGTQPF